MVYVAIMGFILVSVQGIMGVIQYKNMMTFYKEVRSRNTVFSVGQQRKYGRNQIAILGCDEDLVIKEAYIMKGITIFARFKPIVDAAGLTVAELKARCTGQPKAYVAVLQAIGFIEEGALQPNPDEQAELQLNA